MPGDCVLTGEVRRPSPVGLRRRRLLEPLLAGGAAPVVVVVAPAGCGKTTLLAQVAAACDGPTGWYRAGPGDESERAFVRHVARALPDVVGSPGAPPSTADELLRDLDTWEGDDAVLVVDDLHEIAGTEAEQVVGRVLELRPPRLRVLLASRRRPSLNLSRLQVSDRLLQLDGDDLRFRSWEVERLFLEVYAEPLPPESTAALTRRTGGWAAGLQMFHLATAGRTSAERRTAVEALNGRTRLLRSYLAENVLGGLPEDRRRFLMRTSALGVLTGPLCDQLLETTGSLALLRWLEDAGLFTVSDDDGLTFRYHQVLQDHLEVALCDELGPADSREWFARSATVLEAAGRVREALRAHARAEDWASVSRLLTRAGHAATDDTHEDWDVLLPARLRDHDPWLLLAHARRRARRGAVRAAVELLERAEALFVDGGARDRCRSQRLLLVPWLPQSPAPARWSDRTAGSRHWSVQVRAATTGLRHRPSAEDVGADEPGDRLALGLTLVLAGRVAQAAPVLEHVADHADPGSVERLAALAVIGLLDTVRGSGTDRLEHAALAAEIGAHPWFDRICRAALATALATAMASRADQRTPAALHLVDACVADGDEWGAALLRFLRGAADALGGGSGEQPELVAAAAAFRRLDAPVPALWAESLRAVCLARGGVPAARAACAAVEDEARSLGVSGARAIACQAQGLLASGPRGQERRRLAAELAEECGFSLPREPVAAAHHSGCARSPLPEDLVRLRLLGGFRLEVVGRAVSWAGVRPRVLTLLRMLALADADVHRERLVEALWPGVDLPTGTRRLQVAVSGLRQALDAAGLVGAEVVRRQADAYGLRLPPSARVDLRDLNAVLLEWRAVRVRGPRSSAVTIARRVLTVYDGELLPEDGAAEWVVAERERLRLAVAEVARGLAEVCVEPSVEDRGLVEVAEGISAARRSLELDPFQDRPWELLASLHECAGDPVAATRARTQHVRAAAALAAPSSTPDPPPEAGRSAGAPAAPVRTDEDAPVPGPRAPLPVTDSTRPLPTRPLSGAGLGQ